MESVLTCGTHGWSMLAATVLTFGLLALSGAALIKYLFFSRSTPTAA